ncbi:septum formation initiator [Mucilaginibacter sp. PPCGB 2223]|uniref:FtsB family cell division protein n=1 Tax=Mucilaginibacter sp. PPCGB 2223 TaxID=1886027 RepID=UPI00082430CA|nr:septum formation initiator family protein [Mucilaginibacter sp. PPCGB 2223]OCX50865.1 septum formation initiator [Mucilaginibacter sp. PPCGB 2223]
MKRLIALVKNKYFLVTLAFVVWMVFFDTNDLYSQYQGYKDVKNLQKERDYCLKQTEQVNKDLDELNSNPEKLEKFAREKYLMKKDNEDVFVIVREKKQK